MAPTIIGFISEKGGVGKTTAIYHIAIALARYESCKLLVVDTDYQRGGVTGRFKPALLEHFHKGTMPGTTLYHVFRSLYSGMAESPIPDIVPTKYTDVDLMPSDPRLTEVSVDKLPGSNNIRENNLKLFQHLSAIADALDRVEEYDYILIDTHPETSELLRSVIYSTQYCVSPVKLDEQSSVGVPSAIEAVNGVINDVTTMQNALNIASDFVEPKFVGAIGMMAREYGGELKWSENVQYRRLEAAGGIFSKYVTEGDGLRQAAAVRCPVFDVSGQNALKQSRQFKELTKEFMEKCPI